MPPVIAPTTGMMMSPTSEFTIAAERRADDHADGEIDHVAAQGEFLEILKHGSPRAMDPESFARASPS